MKAIALASQSLLAALLLSGVAAADDDDLSLDDLPAVVRATVEREVGAGVIEDIEWESRPAGSYYEVEFFLDGKDWELHVAEDGKVLKKQLD